MYVTKSILCSDTGKWLSFEVSLPSDRNRCVKFFYTYACFIHRFLSADQLQGRFSPLSILDRWKPMSSYTFTQSILLVSSLFWVSVFFLFLRATLFIYCRMHCEDANISSVFSDVAEIWLICLIFSPIYGATAIQRAHDTI